MGGRVGGRGRMFGEHPVIDAIAPLLTALQTLSLTLLTSNSYPFFSIRTHRIVAAIFQPVRSQAAEGARTAYRPALPSRCNEGSYRKIIYVYACLRYAVSPNPLVNKHLYTSPYLCVPDSVRSF